MYIGDLRNGETVQCRRQACYRNIDAANCCAATRIDEAQRTEQYREHRHKRRAPIAEASHCSVVVDDEPGRRAKKHVPIAFPGLDIPQAARRKELKICFDSPSVIPRSVR